MKIVIKNGNLHDGRGSVLPKTDVLIEDGKIMQIAKDLSIKADCVIDAENKEVLPGWIDPVSGWGCAAGRGQARDNDEQSEAITPQLSAYYAFDPESMKYQKLYEMGITSAGIAPANSNLLGGSMAVFKCWGEGLEDMLVKEGCAMKGSLTQFKNVYGSRKVLPMTRMGAFDLLKETLRKAEKMEEAEKDEKLKALEPVLKGEKALVMSCNTAADIAALRHLLKDRKIRLTIANAYGLSKALLETDCPIVLGDLTDGFSKFNQAVDYDTLFAMIQQGRPVALSAFGDGASPGREILLWNAQEIARQAAKRGLDFNEEDLLMLLSWNPARILGVEDQIGSLAPGLDADLIVWTANPLVSNRAQAETVIISGKIVKGGNQDEAD